MAGLPEQCEVLIAGAGPTGLTLGLRLRQLGIQCRIVDKQSEPSAWSRALGLHARTLEFFQMLGVLEAVQSRAIVLKNVTLNSYRKPLFSIDLGTLEAPYPWVLSCSQSWVESCLREAFLAAGGEILRAHELVSFRQTPSSVESVLRTPSGDKWVRSRVLVGCDGAHSRVRELLDFRFEGMTEADSYWLADVQCDGDWPRDASQAAMDRKGTLIALPMPEGWRLILNGPLLKSSGADEPDIETFQRLLDEHWNAPLQIRSVQWLSRFSIHRRLVSAYRNNRVFLAGDACHVQSPAGAQGMNTGIADSMNLSWKLALYLQGIGGGALLDTYQQERRPVARRMLYQIDILSRLTFAGHPLLRTLRDAGLRMFRYLPFLQRRLVRRLSQLDVSYRDSRFSSMADLHTLPQLSFRVGDRFPPLSFRNKQQDRSILDLLQAGKLVVLVAVPDLLQGRYQLPVMALAERLQAEYEHWVQLAVLLKEGEPERAIAKEDRELLALWNVETSCCEAATAEALPSGIWVIRPDGHLALMEAITDADEVISWLRKLQNL